MAFVGPRRASAHGAACSHGRRTDRSAWNANFTCPAVLPLLMHGLARHDFKLSRREYARSIVSRSDGAHNMCTRILVHKDLARIGTHTWQKCQLRLYRFSSNKLELR